MLNLFKKKEPEIDNIKELPTADVAHDYTIYLIGGGKVTTSLYVKPSDLDRAILSGRRFRLDTHSGDVTYVYPQAIATFTAKETE